MSTLLAPTQSQRVVVIGNFDGVHLGHQALLATARSLAGPDTEVLALTFEPHPTAWFRKSPADTWRLTTPQQRHACLLEAGADIVKVLPFDATLASMSAATFIEELLVTELRARSVVVGEDFRFGANRAGDVALLRIQGDNFGYTVTALGAVLDGGEPVSSTRIRTALGTGDLETARRLLGRPWSYEGVVAAGWGRGKQLGIPTLNLYPQDVLLPPYGVYATWLCTGERRHPAITNLGVRPTFADDPRVSIETLVLEAFPGPASDGQIQVEFVHRIREERAFPSPQELQAQIALDVAVARTVLDGDHP